MDAIVFNTMKYSTYISFRSFARDARVGVSFSFLARRVDARGRHPRPTASEIASRLDRARDAEDVMSGTAPTLECGARANAVVHFGVGNELLVCNLDDAGRNEAPRCATWARVGRLGASVATSTSAALLTLREREVRGAHRRHARANRSSMARGETF